MTSPRNSTRLNLAAGASDSGKRSQIVHDERDLWKHRLLVFREQGSVPGPRQADIGRWFGELDSEPFYKHPASPCYDVFRVSNDENEGCRGVGRTGWHIDGTFQLSPYIVSLYHIVAAPKQSSTRFVPLQDVFESLSQEKQTEWDRLWMLSDRRDQEAKPLDLGLPSEKRLLESDTIRMLSEINRAINVNDGQLIYEHKYEPGDFIISDNLAVGHEASPDTQRPPSEIGLRIMHRVTVKGTVRPSKSAHS